jgi:threonine/homoserine/homoserine lactone efflux protein
LINRNLLSILLQGALLGLSIAAPVGPIGLLCIRRTAARGFRSGFFSGLGAASADAFYGMVAAAGLTLVADFLVRQGEWLALLGGAFLVYLGVRTFISQPPAEGGVEEGGSNAGDYFSTFLLTLSNPLTIFSFAAILSGFSANSAANFRQDAFVFVLGVFSGSALWWLALSAAVHTLRGLATTRALVWVNHIAGTAIAIFGLLMGWRGLSGLLQVP